MLSSNEITGKEESFVHPVIYKHPKMLAICFKIMCEEHWLESMDCEPIATDATSRANKC